ncbi:MAG: HAMP domain-containing histidine kinase [Bacteroidetes bacterium]|nr:HAMP domain-containing histidine kinase [Bacteroidota bacterium]
MSGAFPPPFVNHLFALPIVPGRSFTIMSAQTSQSSASQSQPEGTHVLFWKVLVLVIATAMVATFAIGLYSRYALRDNYNTFLREQIASYLTMVVQTIGTPPDTSAARYVAAHYPLDVRVEHNGFAWSSAGSLTPPFATILEETDQSVFDRGDTILFREFDQHLHGIVRSGGWTYEIRLRSEPKEGLVLPATIGLGVILLLLLYAAYRVVQRLLRPIPALMQGVKAVASENFEHTVPVESNDELGELTKAFNAMSQRLAAVIASKRRLLFDVSHELRTPLTRMRVAMEMLPEGRAKVSIERNVHELATMITELLENERLAVLGGALVVETVDVVALVQKVVDSFVHDSDRLELDSLTGSLEITADSQRLIVALRNVISNALKYSAESGGPVKVTVFPDDNGARVVVTDTGIGISLEAQAKVFEPFYRTDESRTRSTGGYGLGLSLTKSIVDAHGGVIQLSSSPGCGTTVMLWLPHAPAQGAAVRNLAAQPSTQS